MSKKSKSEKGKVPQYLKDAVQALVKDATKEGSTASLVDRCRAIDRGLKLAAIEAKMDDGNFGSAFDKDPEED